MKKMTTISMLLGVSALSLSASIYAQDINPNANQSKQEVSISEGTNLVRLYTKTQKNITKNVVSDTNKGKKDNGADSQTHVEWHFKKH